jgi:glycosyl hydrolase family 28
MNLKKYLLIIFVCLLSVPVLAKDYKASLFGINSDGVTLNTTSIQFAIDYIHENGGGRLVFYVGRYVTGSIYLKSNVTIQLEEGAVLVGSLNPFDYDKKIFTSLIFAYDQKNIGITGKGIIDGRGNEVAKNVVDIIEKGLLKDSYKNGRASEGNRPMIINFRNCTDIVIRRITLRNSASWNETYDQCKNLLVDSVTVDNTYYWNEDGVDIVDCENVKVSNCYIDAADDGICLKSHDATKICKNILIINNKIRTSANGIKFGTASKGGFEKVRIINNIVFDTYRSAIALEAVDGGYIDDIEIDSLQSINTGNIIFLRTGERVEGKKSRLENVKISNVTGDVPATKPDAGYGYEGPEEDQPRNVSPAIIIVGLPDAVISNISLQNISFTHAGGGKQEFAILSLDKLNTIPELPAQYPEFSMFKELPAWAIFIKHAANIKFSALTMVCLRKDFRVPIVLDDVSKATFSGVKITQQGKKKDIYQNNSKAITIK